MRFLELFLSFINSFHIQLLIAGLLFWNQIKPRMRKSTVFLLLGAYCIIPFFVNNQNILSPFFQMDKSGVWANSFYLVALAFGLVLCLCFHFESIKEFLFYYIPSIIAQHAVFDINTILDHLLENLPQIALLCIHLMTMIIVYLLVYKYIIRRFPEENVFSTLRNGYLVFFTLFATFLVYGLSVWTRSNEVFTYGGYLFDLVSCALILVVHFGKFTQSKLEHEKEIILQLLQAEQDKHRISTQTIEMINRKTHDLKYQIASIKKMNYNDQQSSIIDLEKAVNDYDNSLKTNNETLDILLYERSILWEKYSINFSCIADGIKLNFIQPDDLYALFGNALDNAIESVQSIDNISKRIISLNISSKGNIIVISISNYCNKEIMFEGNLPLTTKPDKEYHGYGMKSMQYIAEKYGGTLSVQLQNEVFILTIMLPSA